jgi:hypothetical protein
MGMSLLIFIATETGASKPLHSKMTSTSADIPAFRQSLQSCCLANGHIPSQYVLLIYNRKMYGVLTVCVSADMTTSAVKIYHLSSWDIIKL